MNYTTGDGDVFALRYLPEEAIAVLFAKYSRSQGSLRATLATMLDAPTDEPVRDFHRRVVREWKHRTVAEHAVVHLAMENISILAAKAVEDARVGASFTEKSTRFVDFSTASVVLPPCTEPALNLARRATSDLIATYTRLTVALIERLGELFPTSKLAARRSLAFDLLRGLLPAGVCTNVGMTINTSALEHLLIKLSESPLPEVCDLAGKLAEHAAKVAPALVTSPKPAREPRYLELMECEAWEPRGCEVHPAYNPPQSIIRDLAAMIVFERMGGLPGGLLANPDKVVQDYLAARGGASDQPGRMLEQVRFTFCVGVDYGAWRDLQRNRLVSASTPVLTCALGYHLEPALADVAPGIYAGAVQALEEAGEAWHRGMDLGVPVEHLQYLCPLAARVRYLVTMNLRELHYLVELRSPKDRHPSYRAVVQKMADHALGIFPQLAGGWRVDRTPFSIAERLAVSESGSGR